MKEEQQIYAPQVLEFITVSTELCKQLELCHEAERKSFIEVMCKLLPMVYVKAALVGSVEEASGYNQEYVTEEDYNFIRSSVANIMGAEDEYLDTFKEDFKYSEQPILCAISESLADIYQPLRNLVEIYRQGYDDAMEVALFDAMEQFKLYWGQTLLNVLRALHAVRYNEA
ncbi:MAG: DUF5063 domain-containing protein [Alloprevotella sp.]|nr:DUF5063 domain-containing protein [Alloprevotella sp.]